MVALRPIAPLRAVSMQGVTLAPVAGALPELAWAKPTDLFVEPDYQRDLSDRSITLIRRIAANWKWAHVKPCICAKVAGKLMVIDGQHTAIAAATRGDIAFVPVMVVEAAQTRDRAMAFLGQNRDRVALTALHMHHAAAAAGDEIAVAVVEAAKRARVEILRYQNGAMTNFKVGDTTAIGIITTLVRQRGVTVTARVLKVLVEAKRAPIAAVEIAAVAIILADKGLKVDTFDLATVIRSRTVPEWVALAAAFVAKGAGKRRQALASVWLHELARAR